MRTPTDATTTVPVATDPTAPAIRASSRAPRRQRAPEKLVVGASLAALVALVALVVLVCVAASRTPALLPESIRPAPSALRGAFAAVGLDLHTGGAIAALALMFVAYAVVAGSARRLPAWAVIGAIAIVELAIVLGPLLISTDVFSYEAYARMGAVYGLDPYLNGPHAIALDPVFAYVGARWSYTPSAYGPMFTAISYALARLPLAGAVFLYKLIAALASLGLLAIVWRCARVLRVNRVRALALVGLNPLLLLYGVGGGHNDSLMLLASAGAILALSATRERTAGALFVAAAAIKLTAGLLLPFALVAPGQAESPLVRRRVMVGVVAAGVTVWGLSFALFGTGALHLARTIGSAQRDAGLTSIPGLVSVRLGSPAAGHLIGDGLAATVAVVCVWLLVRVRRGALGWIAGAGWATAALLVGSSSLQPWYVGWLLPLAALAGDARLRRASITLTGMVLVVSLLGEVPH